MSKISAPVKVRPFHFWSQKVLPLVYDDSLSYYEVLGKVTERLNDLIGVINDELDDYVRERIDELFINATYDATNESITLVLERSESND